MFSRLTNELIDALQCLPGVGRKTAQRMTLHLLERDRDAAKQLSSALTLAMDKVGHCAQCRGYTEERLCELCNSSRRDATTLCVVETPADVMAIEQGAAYSGLYFVLMGRLSPLDGIGPEELGLDLLEQRLSTAGVQELILATNPTVEGEATAHYIAQIAVKHAVKVSRIAYGVPVGGELEYVDGGTLAHAFSRRETL
ncbi:MAG: recombination protein RecR [Gammaproteobacteria bacterium]|jgi:recombination protein RecR